MQRFLAALAVVVAFLAGRETKTEVHARPAVVVQREVVTAPAVESPAHCPDALAIELDQAAEPEPEAGEPEAGEPEADEPAAVEIADTAVVRQLDREARLRVALERNVSGRGAIFGAARDAKTGEILVGVTVVTSARGASQVAITDETGYYEITDLEPDNYTVTFYYADATIEHAGVAVAAHKSTPVYTKFDTSSAGGEVITLDTNYVKNIPVTRHFEDVLGAAGDEQGVSISSGSQVENEYIVVE